MEYWWARVVCAFLFGISERLATALVYTFLSHVFVREQVSKAVTSRAAGGFYLAGRSWQAFGPEVARVLPLYVL